MIAVDYDFYLQVYKGKMTQEDFERLSVKASAYLDYVTFGRINDALPDSVQQKVKLALCEVVDTYLLNEQGGGIASESNDGISVTYVSSSNAKTDTQRLYSAVSLYLGGTGLLYRGVD